MLSEHAMRALARAPRPESGQTAFGEPKPAACAANQEDARYLVPTAYHARA